jgi:hypothetical protein
VKNFDHLAGENPTSNIRLVCRYYQNKPEPLEELTGLQRTRQNFEFVQIDRRIRLSTTNQRPIDHPITVEKDRFPSVMRRCGVLGAHGSTSEAPPLCCFKARKKGHLRS